MPPPASAPPSAAPLARADSTGRTRRGGAADFEDGIVEIFVRLARAAGLPKSYGEIYGLLFASAQPLSFGDIQERLGLSKGSVSQGIRALREVGAIRLARVPDDGRDHFEPETELRSLVGGFLRESIQPQLADSDRRLATLRGHLAGAGAAPGRRKILQARLDKLSRWHRQGRALLPWITKFLG
jgi:DNA-binding transcriptional regulator GbsR (MarR family)